MNTTKMKWIRSRIVLNKFNNQPYLLLLYKEHNSNYFVINSHGFVIARNKNLKKLKLVFSQMIRKSKHIIF